MENEKTGEVRESDTILGVDGKPALKIVSANDSTDDSEADMMSNAVGFGGPDGEKIRKVTMGLSVDPDSGLISMFFGEPVSRLSLLPPDWLAVCMLVMSSIQRLMVGEIPHPSAQSDDNNGKGENNNAAENDASADNVPLRDIPKTIVENNTMPPYFHHQ